MRRTRYSVPSRWLFSLIISLSLLFALGERAICADSPLPIFALESPLIRVGLMRFSSASILLLSAEPGAVLFGPTGRQRAAGAGIWTLTWGTSGAEVKNARGRRLGIALPGKSWRLQSTEPDTQLSLARPGQHAQRYCGNLEITVTAQGLRVINEVPLENYVRGVIGSEMGTNAPLEALKAQAIASRTFALSSLGRWANEGYDLRDTTDSQVYTGCSLETLNTLQAVQETSGLILTVANQPIPALFCADCGGITTPGAKPNDCPHSVSDALAHGSAETPLRPSWTLRYTPEQLTALLNKQASTRSLGILDTLEILEQDVSGRVRRLRLAWISKAKESVNHREHGEHGEIPNPPIPTPPRTSQEETPGQNSQEVPKIQTPKPKIQNREVGGNTLRTLLGLDTLRSTLFTVRRDTTNGEFVIEGRGWGHGRGMCQVGAMALASAPNNFDYQAILKHYYAGATLSRIQYLEEGSKE